MKFKNQSCLYNLNFFFPMYMHNGTFLIRESHTGSPPSTLGVKLNSVHARDNAYLMVAAFIIFILSVLCVAIGFIIAS